jgi:hypothetical protein
VIYRTRIEVRYRARSTGSCAVCGGRMKKNGENGRPLEFRPANAGSGAKWIPVHAGCLHVAEDRTDRAPNIGADLIGGFLGNVLGQIIMGSSRSAASFRNDRAGSGVPLRRQHAGASPTRPALPSPNAPIDAEFEEK